MAARKPRSTTREPVLKATAKRQRKVAADVAAPPPPPPPVSASPASSERKIDLAIALLQRPKGATLVQIAELTGWKVQSVRGFLSGTLKSRRGLTITSEKTDGVRAYRLAGGSL